MENNNQWSWGDLEEQPQKKPNSWEIPTTPKPESSNIQEGWGNLEDKDSTNSGWSWNGAEAEEQLQQPNNNPFTESSTNNTTQTNEEWGDPSPTLENDMGYSYLGSVSKVQIQTELFYLKNNFSQGLKDLEDCNLNPHQDKGKYDFSPQPSTELGNIIHNLTKIALSKNQKIKDCFIYKLSPDEESIKFNNTSPYTFIYTLQSKTDGGSLIFDLSEINGPTIKGSDTIPNLAALIPGWVPFSLGKNTSDTELVVIMGTLDNG